MSEKIETKVMYVWKVEVEERWDDDNFFSEGGVDYRVSAEDHDGALEKVRGVALNRSFVDDDDGKTHNCMEIRLVSIKRGEELDA